jgi:hypothetical protein
MATQVHGKARRNAVRIFLSFALSIFLMGSGSTHSAESQSTTVFLRLPVRQAKAFGPIESIHVEVACSWISGLKNVPELYDIRMGYDVPAVDMFDADPRLGAAAVGLAAWDGVIGVRIPPDADARSCFKVTVSVGGRSGKFETWTGRQLGLP